MVAAEAGSGQVARMRGLTLAELSAALPPGALAAAQRCSARLRSVLPEPDRLGRNMVLVAFGGGKDSAYTVAFVRAMQLILFRAHGCTFRLRTVTMRHAGMPAAVMANIDRTYRALRLQQDPQCELLLIDGSEITAFDPDAPQREHVIRRNRLDILMTGHRTFADGRPTFCNACNLSVARSFGLAAAYGDGADVIITGDSQQEQRQYALWISRLASSLGVPADGQPRGGIGRLLTRLDGIAQVYFTDIHGPGATTIPERRVEAGVPERLQFFSVYPDTEYASGHHMELLTGFLGFGFDEIAFSFTESDCGNPTLMAHLRGLRCEHVFGRPYAEGMREYADFALGLMASKDFPAGLIELMRQRYAGPDAMARRREAAAAYALTTFGLTEEQLICMVWSPFGDHGARLDEFLHREHPALAGQASQIRALLASADRDVPDLDALAALHRVSGLELTALRRLYRSKVRDWAKADASNVIGTVLAGDPHKAVIQTSHARHGPGISEQISGR